MQNSENAHFPQGFKKYLWGNHDTMIIFEFNVELYDYSWHVCVLHLPIEKCLLGQYSIEGHGYEPCNLCPDGSWQNETGESFCYSCELGYTTGREGATSTNDCGECGKYITLILYTFVLHRNTM